MHGMDNRVATTTRTTKNGTSIKLQLQGETRIKGRGEEQKGTTIEGFA